MWLRVLCANLHVSIVRHVLTFRHLGRKQLRISIAYGCDYCKLLSHHGNMKSGPMTPTQYARLVRPWFEESTKSTVIRWVHETVQIMVGDTNITVANPLLQRKVNPQSGVCIIWFMMEVLQVTNVDSV
jgi:hypothetical protein